MHSNVLFIAIIIVLIIIIVYGIAQKSRYCKILETLESTFKVSLPRKEPLRNLTKNDLLKERNYSEYKLEIDNIINRAYELEDFGKDTKLSQSCNYATSSGKRIRSIVLSEIARMTSKQTGNVVDVADLILFIEYIHCASLIIDDMPEFDNDETRRNKQSVHAKFGKASAQMASLTLLTCALQNFCRQIDWIKENSDIKNADMIGMKIQSIVANSIGINGACGGQLLEISPDDWKLYENIIEKIAIQKTASLFELAVGCGWLISGGGFDMLNIMMVIGRKLGCAFQIADDIGDMQKDKSKVTKDRPDTNYANMYGKDIALNDMEQHLRGVELLLTRYELISPLWKNEIFQMVRNMIST